MMEQMLRQYTCWSKVSRQGMIGLDYEVVPHEILPENSRVAAIANSSISGRASPPITNAALLPMIRRSSMGQSGL